MKCIDCGRFAGKRPYYTGENDEEGEFALCVDCAGPFLCPDYPETSTPGHLRACVGSCAREARGQLAIGSTKGVR